MNFINLKPTKEHFNLLEQFYFGLFISEFPDENERESLENMKKYLTLKEKGWYKNNNYYIILAEHENNIIGCVIADYFSKPNCGAIEFLVVDPNYREQHIATKLLAFLEDILKEHAKTQGKNLDFIFGEMNDPNKTQIESDSMDPYLRLKFWNKKEYYVLDAPYFQPALSEDSLPVENLVLIAKIFNENYLKNSIPTKVILQCIYDYLFWAMRIKAPTKNEAYKRMHAYSKQKEYCTSYKNFK